MLRDKLTSLLAGGSGTLLGVILGAINVEGLIQAFLYGIAGALGGLLVGWLKKKCSKSKK
jgi:hypothetical protein